jgi:hypothetical protein
MNITYLLGAGASANCLPVINELPNRLQEFRKFINSFSLGGEHQIVQTDIDSDIQWLLNEMRKHKTVDTLARKYYLISKKHKDLMRLKRLLTVYFMFEQTHDEGNIRSISNSHFPKELPDKRYDTFIASLITPKIDSLTMPPSIKVITWNYDMQMEIAYTEYAGCSTLLAQDLLQSIPSRTFVVDKLPFSTKRFGLIRLNGVAGIAELVRGKTFIDTVKNKKGVQLAEALLMFNLKLYEESKEVTENYRVFNFSWEDSSEFSTYLFDGYNEVKSAATQVMSETEILVVIGYSFPYFNRQMDKKLFSNCPALKKVYIQDQNAIAIAQLVKSSFELFQKEQMWSDYNGIRPIPQVPIETVTYVDQFFIPYEMG